MATSQVLQWMKNDVQLSRVICNFEEDFSNGYLFGEILVQFGIFQDISEFSKKSNKQAKVHNFQQVEEALRFLGVKFDARLIHQIMNEERGAALRLLYQLKLALSRWQGEDGEQMTMTGLKQATVNKKLMDKFEQSVAAAHSGRFENQKMTHKQNSIDKQLVRFQMAKEDLLKKGLKDQDDENELVRTLQQKQRHDNMTKIQENKQFMKEWQEEGHQNWKINQTKRRENIARVKYFEDKEVEAYKNKLNKELTQGTEEMRGGISEFEKNLQKLGIEQNVDLQEALKKMEEKKGIPPGQIQNFSYAATMNKIKESKKNTDFAGKERERRRRKLMVDQARTQQTLDKQRAEDQLLQKLLEKNQEEQNQAYTYQRLAQCKQMEFNNKKQRAEIIAAESAKNIEAMENKRKEESKFIDEKRKEEFLEQKKVYQLNRKDQKSSKRRVNIEIASEVVDLIMDIVDEAYDTQLATNDKKLNKQMWREWMQLFKDGTKVSRKNFIQQEDEPIQATSEDSRLIKFNPEQNLYDFMNEYKNNSSFVDFYQYLCNCGAMNLVDLSGAEKWGSIAQIEGLGCNNFDFLTLDLPKQNEELAQMIQQIYARTNPKPMSARSGISNNPEAQMAQKGIPKDLGLQMCLLGRAFSGKKTVAQMLASHFKQGNNEIKIFNMNDLIKEVFDYVTPKKVDETAVDPKAKGKKGAKQDDVPTDPYEGKDSTAIKSIGLMVKAFFGEELPTKCDLVSRISDDQLLVRLFLAKLKLSFPADRSKDEIIQEMKNNLNKEKELTEQIKEIEAANANQAQDPKAAKKGGKGGSGSAESIKDELKALQTVKTDGWILIDFPRNMTQMKLLEKAFSGYINPTDKAKKQTEVQFETLSKFATPQQSFYQGFEGKVDLTPSGLDSIIYLDTPADECHRRQQNRKIDPQTSTVYHMDDNPPPEDNKLLERLQDYSAETGDEARLNEQHRHYEKDIHNIKKWNESFGHVSESNVQITLDNAVSVEDWKDKNQILDKVLNHVNQLISIKQEAYDKKMFEVQVLMVQEAEQAAREAAEAEERKQQEAQAAEDQSKAEAAEEVSASKRDDANNVTVDEKSIQEDDGNYIMDSNIKIKVEGDREGGLKPMSSVGSRSFAASSKLSSKPITINDEEKVKMWESMLLNFYQNGLQCFNMLQHQRKVIFNNLSETQINYISYLSRPDQLQVRINEFINNFNRFSEEFPELRDNEQTRQELGNRVEILSKSLWDIIQRRKREALDERQRLMKGGWVQREMMNLIVQISRLLECEYQRFSTVSQIFASKKINDEIDLESLAQRFHERGTPIVETGKSSPLFDKLCISIIQRAESMTNDMYLSQLDAQYQESIKMEKQNFYFKLNSIKSWINLMLEEINDKASQVFDVLDDWVVIAIKNENESVKKAINELHEAVKHDVQFLETIILTQKDLHTEIETIKFEMTRLPAYMDNIEVRDQANQLSGKRFKVEQLTHLYKEFKFHSSQEYLDADSFLNLMVLQYQQGNVPFSWRYMDFDKIYKLIKQFNIVLPVEPLYVKYPRAVNHQSDGSNDLQEFVNWKLLFTKFALVHSISRKSLTSIQKYRDELKKLADAETGFITKENFLNVDAWFDSFEGLVEGSKLDLQMTNLVLQGEPENSDDEENTLDEKRIQEIKSLLYDTHRQTNQDGLNVDSFIDALVKVATNQAAEDLNIESFKSS